MGAFRKQLMNFVWKYIFLITQDLRSKFTPIVQFEWWDWRSRNQSSQDYEEHSHNFSKPVGKSRSRKYSQWFLKTIISYCLQNRQRLEFQKATHTCTSCFCLEISHPFASDTSPKWIDREGLGKIRTGTWQGQFVNFSCMQMSLMMIMRYMMKWCAIFITFGTWLIM